MLHYCSVGPLQSLVKLYIILQGIIRRTHESLPIETGWSFQFFDSVGHYNFVYSEFYFHRELFFLPVEHEVGIGVCDIDEFIRKHFCMRYVTKLNFCPELIVIFYVKEISPRTVILAQDNFTTVVLIDHEE